jgi:alpha-L-arabinofuranosidase
MDAQRRLPQAGRVRGRRPKVNIAGNERWRTESIKTLSSQNVRDYNTVENPDTVCVHSGRIEGSSGDLVVTVEPHSVSALVLNRL